jgi:hypothetical protein
VFGGWWNHELAPMIYQKAAGDTDLDNRQHTASRKST